MEIKIARAALTGIVFAFLLFRPVQWRTTRILVFPGVVLHEIAHWLVALVLGGNPSTPALMPIRSADGSWELGSVSFVSGRGRTAWVGLAPVLLACPAAYLLFRDGNLFTFIWSSVIAGYLLWASLPSSQDLAVALTDPVGLLTVAAAASLAWLALT